MRGAMRGLTDNLEKYQSHYVTFFKILNSAASIMGPTLTAGVPKSINSPVLTQILGNLNMLHLKNDWTKLGAQDYNNIAKTGQLVGRYLTRYPTGPKAITINKDHKLQKFQPSHITGYKGDMALAQCSGMGGTFPPIHRAHDLPELGKILTRHHMTHAFLLVDSLPGALTSPISGAQIAELPTTLTEVYNKTVSYTHLTLPTIYSV